MGIKVDLDEDLEKEFRELAMKRFGYSKGSIKKATESAIRQWTSTEFRPSLMQSKKQKKSGTDLLTGLLKNVKHKGSVEEQHEIGKLWARAAVEHRR